MLLENILWSFFSSISCNIMTIVRSYADTPLAGYVTLPFKWFGGLCNSQKNLCMEGYWYVFTIVLLTPKS